MGAILGSTGRKTRGCSKKSHLDKSGKNPALKHRKKPIYVIVFLMLLKVCFDFSNIRKMLHFLLKPLLQFYCSQCTSGVYSESVMHSDDEVTK